MAVVLRKEKRAWVRSRNNLKESTGFNKNIKKSGPLIMGVGGQDSSSSSSCSRFSLIVLLVIRNIPLYLKVS